MNYCKLTYKYLHFEFKRSVLNSRKVVISILPKKKNANHYAIILCTSHFKCKSVNSLHINVAPSQHLLSFTRCKCLKMNVFMKVDSVKLLTSTGIFSSQYMYFLVEINNYARPPRRIYNCDRNNVMMPSTVTNAILICLGILALF